MIFSKITYCSPQSIENWTCYQCKKYPMVNVRYIQNNITHIVGYIAYDSSRNRIVIAWRGTIDTRNWIEDGQFAKVSYPCQGCQIHSGFYLAYLSVQFQVIKHLEQLLKKYPNAKIHVTGHSLGGALATVSAIQLQRRYGKVEVLHSLASPRIGNLNFVRYLESQIEIKFRVVHNQDLVPHLPFIQLGYHHHSYEVFYNEQMSQYKICDQSGEDPSCSNKFFPNYTTADHDTYFKNQTKHIC